MYFFNFWENPLIIIFPLPLLLNFSVYFESSALFLGRHIVLLPWNPERFIFVSSLQNTFCHTFYFFFCPCTPNRSLIFFFESNGTFLNALASNLASTNRWHIVLEVIGAFVAYFSCEEVAKGSVLILWISSRSNCLPLLSVVRGSFGAQ